MDKKEQIGIVCLSLHQSQISVLLLEQVKVNGNVHEQVQVPEKVHEQVQVQVLVLSPSSKVETLVRFLRPLECPEIECQSIPLVY